MRKLLAVTVVALLAWPSALANPRTTEARTILDRDGDNRLEPAKGDPHVVRRDLGGHRGAQREGRFTTA